MSTFKKFVFWAITLFILSSISNLAHTKTISGTIAFDDAIILNHQQRLTIRIQAAEPLSNFDTIEQELIIDSAIPGSNQFSIEIENTEERFIVGVHCRLSCNNIWPSNFENNGNKAGYKEQARVFNEGTNNVSGLNIIVSNTIKLQGFISFSGEEATNSPRLFITLSPDLERITATDPDSGGTIVFALVPPQDSVQFENNQFVAPYEITFPAQIGVQYTLGVACTSGCVTGNAFYTDTDGRLIPSFSSFDDEFPAMTITDLEAQELNLFLDAFTGPIDVSGKIQLLNDNTTDTNYSTTLNVFASANPNKIIARRNYVIPSNGSVDFSFDSLISDPSGSELGFSLSCPNCSRTEPELEPKVLLNARQDHSNINLVFNATKKNIILAPLNLLFE